MPTKNLTAGRLRATLPPKEPQQQVTQERTQGQRHIRNHNQTLLRNPRKILCRRLPQPPPARPPVPLKAKAIRGRTTSLHHPMHQAILEMLRHWMSPRTPHHPPPRTQHSCSLWIARALIRLKWCSQQFRRPIRVRLRIHPQGTPPHRPRTLQRRIPRVCLRECLRECSRRRKPRIFRRLQPPWTRPCSSQRWHIQGRSCNKWKNERRSRRKLLGRSSGRAGR